MRRSLLLIAPAAVPTALVLGTGLTLVVAQSLGLFSVIGPSRVSLDAYTAVASSGELGSSLLLSLGIATAATTLAVVVGLVTALAVRATRVGGRRGRRGSPTRHSRSSTPGGSQLLSAVAAATIPVPHLIGAAAMGLLLSDSGLLARVAGSPSGQWPQLVAGPWWTAVVLEFGWKESAFVALVVLSVLSAHAGVLDETAAVLGASGWARFRYVTLPLARPGLVLAGGISFVYVLGSYEVGWLLGRAYPEPLPVLAYRLFTSSELAARPEALAVSMLTVAMCAVVGLVTLTSMRRWTVLE